MITDPSQARAPLELRIPLLSRAAALAFPLSAVGVTLFVYFVIGCFEPRFELTCRRSPSTPGVCRATERTFVSVTGPTTLALAEPRFELDDVRSRHRRRGVSLSRLRIVTSAGVPAFETRLKDAPAIIVEREVRRFLVDPTQTTLTLSEGYSGGFFLAMVPLMMLITLGPIWGLGGHIVVRARADGLGVARVRVLHRSERNVAFAAGVRPTIALDRLGGRYKRQGVLSVTVPGRERVVLVQSALFDVLEPIRAQLERYYAAR